VKVREKKRTSHYQRCQLYKKKLSTSNQTKNQNVDLKPPNIYTSCFYLFFKTYSKFKTDPIQVSETKYIL
jgi:hypothetical protein